VERVRAAASAARALGRDFVLVARADGVMLGSYDLEEAIRRIRAFEAAGADCVYVPIPGDAAALARVVASVSVPVNALAAGPIGQLTRAEMAAIGVARISLGSSLARMTHRVILDAARAMFTEGRFDSQPLASGKEVDSLLALPGASPSG
jgi:2-methylisocitrate lyase-like PEP mutase family enzyme